MPEALLPHDRADVAARENDVVEEGDVYLVRGPPVGNVAFQCQRVCLEQGGFAPVDALPVALQRAIDPERLLAVGLARSIVLEHELDANPPAPRDDPRSVETVVYFEEASSVLSAQYIAALKAAKFDGYLTIEREVGDDPRRDIAAAIGFLKALL